MYSSVVQTSHVGEPATFPSLPLEVAPLIAARSGGAL